MFTHLAKHLLGVTPLGVEARASLARPLQRCPGGPFGCANIRAALLRSKTFFALLQADIGQQHRPRQPYRALASVGLPLTTKMLSLCTAACVHVRASSIRACLLFSVLDWWAARRASGQAVIGNVNPNSGSGPPTRPRTTTSRRVGKVRPQASSDRRAQAPARIGGIAIVAMGGGPRTTTDHPLEGDQVELRRSGVEHAATSTTARFTRTGGGICPPGLRATQNYARNHAWSVVHGPVGPMGHPPRRDSQVGVQSIPRSNFAG